MKFFNLFIIPLVSLSIISCSANIDPLVESHNKFAIDLYSELKNQEGNLFLSPFSISTVFRMAAQGAKGDTAEQMKKVLHHSAGATQELMSMLTNQSDEKRDCELNVSHALWVQEGLNIVPEFSKALKNDYNAVPNQVNFVKNLENTIKTINQWVSDGTKGKIPQLLTSNDVSEDTALILTSAIYMKGNWVHEFDETMTEKKPFYQSEGKVSQVDMMSHYARYSILMTPSFDLLEIPYLNLSSGPRLAMYLFLPREQNGLASVEKELSEKNIRMWMDNMDSMRVHLSLPKFKMEQSFDLNQAMKSLGMEKAFDPSAADFSGITGNRDLFISKAVHKSFINVDEKGTEAAAATGLVMNLTSVMEQVIYEFVADHPFFFLIADKETGTILFMGRYVE